MFKGTEHVLYLGHSAGTGVFVSAVEPGSVPVENLAPALNGEIEGRVKSP